MRSNFIADPKNNDDGNRGPPYNEAEMADELSARLLEIPDDDEEAQELVLCHSLRHYDFVATAAQRYWQQQQQNQQQLCDRQQPQQPPEPSQVVPSSEEHLPLLHLLQQQQDEEPSSWLSTASAANTTRSIFDSALEQEVLLQTPKRRSNRQSLWYRELSTSATSFATTKTATTPRKRVWMMLILAGSAIATAIMAIWIRLRFAGPPNQPVGPYELIERQEGDDFFQYYNFYEGQDSLGSNGYNTYVRRERAMQLGIVNVTMERDQNDVYNRTGRKSWWHPPKARSVPLEPFLYMMSSPTSSGPRESIRLEGMRKFNRGLFIIDIRHMPVGCGVWPAFWLTDEANWPLNGEIDIVESANYETVAKTALHTTKGCSMYDVTPEFMTGSWDMVQGIPDIYTGQPDMTVRYARDCYVYNPHQWLNQGCVTVHPSNQTLGKPLNDHGGGVFVLEWDPINHNIRTWVFAPHATIPDNLLAAILTVGDTEPVAPDPSVWPPPYGYFPIGLGTGCPAAHFRNMRLVINLAFCGSNAGERYFVDCLMQLKTYKTCRDWVASAPEELNDAYWKIRGVFIYERRWEPAWTNF